LRSLGISDSEINGEEKTSKEIEIKTEPTEKEIDDDVDNSDAIVVLNYENKNVINDFIEDSKRDGVEIVYIHHYPKENKYTIGVKNE